MSTVDLLTLEEARDALDLNDTSPTTRDELLALYVTGISQVFDKEFGPVVARTITDEWHEGGQCRIRLHKAPVLTLTTLTEYTGNTATVLTAETPGSATTGQYRIDATRTIVHRRSSGVDVPFAASGVTVTYEAGRFASTAAVEERWKLAAQIAVKHNWSAGPGGLTQLFEGGGGGITGTGVQTFAIPRAARLLLDQGVPVIA